MPTSALPESPIAAGPAAPAESPIAAGPAAPAEPTSPGPSGPPGGGIFTLEGRRAPGLYLVAWVLSVVGLVLLLIIGPLASDETARVALISVGALVLMVGLAAACGSQTLERRARPAGRYRGPSPVLVFLTYLLLFMVIGSGVILTGLLDPEAPFGFLAVGVLQAFGYLVLVQVFVVNAGALSWRDMGWPTLQGGSLHLVLRAVGEAILVMIPLTLLLVLAGGLLALLLGVEAPSVLPGVATSAESLAVVLAAGIVIPIGEELFFRGFSLTAWWRDLGPRSALIRSAIFFALVHTANIATDTFVEGFLQFVLQTAIILPVGLILGWLFLRRGMAASIAGHITYNTLLLCLSLLVVGLPPSP